MNTSGPDSRRDILNLARGRACSSLHHVHRLMLAPRASSAVGGEAMTDKPLKSLNGKKFEGVLAAPIDTGIIFPFRPKDLWQEFSDKNYDELHRQRIAKMPYLARHLGIQFEGLDLSSYA